MLTILLSISIITDVIHSQSSECGSTGITFCDLNVTLREFMIAKFDQTSFHDFLGHTVRLVFHDCMGPQEYNLDGTGPISICDGCFDFDNGAHKGLEALALNFLENEYLKEVPNNWSNRISRADWWAAIATIAIQYANELAMKGGIHNSVATNDSLPYIPFYIGRADCSSSPDINQTNYNQHNTKSFPDALAGWDYNFKFFNDNFGFNEKEYVAILGAHTLGRMHEEHSGFGTGPWVQGWDLLDNEFYDVLLDNLERSNVPFNWQQELNDNNSAGFTHYEWRNIDGRPSERRFIMLNSDMALVLDVDNETDLQSGGIIGCNYTNCGDNPHLDANGKTSKYYVQYYADNNQEWLNDFANVYRRMILMGYDNVNNVPNDLVTLGEPWYMQQNGITYPPTPSPTESPTPSPTDLPTGRPTRAPFVANTCDPELSHREVWILPQWNEVTDGPAKLVEGLNAFVGSPGAIAASCDDVNIEWYYKFSTNVRPNNDISVALNIRACCPVGSTFGIDTARQQSLLAANFVKYEVNSNAVSDLLHELKGNDYEDEATTAIILNATSGSILTIFIFLTLGILLIINVFCCMYQIKKMFSSKYKLYHKVVATEIDESSADDMQNVKGYQI